MPHSFSRRSFVLGSGAVLATAGAKAEDAGAQQENDQSWIGPLLGHVDATSAVLWARLPRQAQWRMVVTPADYRGTRLERSFTSSAKTDFTARWVFGDLKPGTRYRYRLRGDQEDETSTGEFRTAPVPDADAKVTFAFGSCALEDEGSRAVWRRMLAEKVDGVVLAGDTPYIDRTDLLTQRRRYREFNSVLEFQQLTRSVPCWGTWDDHDFGKNDSDGQLRDKEHARQAFTEYRALANFGSDGEGIYTSFRYGPVEVFLIDARWFAHTGPSPVDPDKPTLLGAAQWEWLKQGLKASTAPWKVLATGIIWDAKNNGEKDHWETYAHERRALFDFIRDEKISGVVLFGGDIHVSRVLRYAAAKTVGYPLYQFISSPIHHRVIRSLNEPHPDLLHSAAVPNTFLKLTFDTTVDQPRLTARFLDKAGKPLFEEISVTLKELTPAS